MPVSGVGQLGAGEQQAFDDHGEDQIATPRRFGGEELLQAQLADHGQDGLDMAVGERAGDPEGLGRRDEGLTLERALDQLDDMVGEMGQVAEGLMGDGLSLADGPSEQMGDVGLSVVDPLRRSHMNAAPSSCHAAIFQEYDGAVKRIPAFLVATFPSRNRG